MNAGAMQKSSVSLSTNPDGTVYCWIAGGRRVWTLAYVPETR